MYSYTWDETTGGILLNSSPMKFSKEPRPVYYREMDILGFDRIWKYEKDDSFPYMWAEANNYYYRGKLIAKTKGGSLFQRPQLIVLEDGEGLDEPLLFVDIPSMVEKNRFLLEKLSQDTIKKIYNNYVNFKDKIDVFYVAFSGGKDSVVALDLVQRALPHNRFKVLFGDTGMEFPDTYRTVDIIKKLCEDSGIQFIRARSDLPTSETWSSFGPPAATIRWCCSVHKTAPQIMALQKIIDKHGFTGMAFTGIRGDESASRSVYEDISFGGKHRGQYSCHPILEWNSAELFIYIYQNELHLNDAYLKGNSRAGCLVCPMSSGRHEYMKMQCYPTEMTEFINRIRATSGKTDFSEQEMNTFIDNGNWKTRKTGRELCFGQDKHIIENEKGKTIITVFEYNEKWKEWAKTIGDLIAISPNLYSIDYRQKAYEISVVNTENGTVFSFPNCGTSKDDIKFLSLFRGVIIKCIYCVDCGVCVANCRLGCIKMEKGDISISQECIHCHQCHDIHEHCLRYNSIRNRIGGERKMKGLDRYFSFGIKKEWMDSYFNYQGSDDFWNTDGDGPVANKKKDAFLNFVKDSGLVVYNKAKSGDKYTKNEPNDFAYKLFELGSDSPEAWALMLCNLAYTSEIGWYIKNILPHEQYTPDKIYYLLEEVMEGDVKGLGKRNIISAFKFLLIKTPFGEELGLGVCDYQEKIKANGDENITLNHLIRDSWLNPHPLVILYSLYRFAEACGDYYQFTLSRLLDHEVDSDGISPTQIFSLDEEIMKKVLNGLTINYPEFITAQFNLDLDSITLNAEKTSKDVLELF